MNNIVNVGYASFHEINDLDDDLLLTSANLKSLNLVNEENKVRYEALKWYFDIVGLDGDKVLRVVDKIPKLY